MVHSMTQGNPIRLILAFTVPLLIGNVFQQFYNIADVIIVGRIIGVHALAAVGAAAPLFMAVLGLTIGLTSGFTVITGQCFGANDADGVRRSVAMSVMLSLAAAILLMVISALFMPVFLGWMNVSSELYQDSYSYVIIIAYGLVAMVAYNLLACIARALGDSKTPLYFLMLSSVLNVILAIVFILQFGWGVPGSAIALVTAQGIAAVSCFLYMRKRFPILRMQRRDWQFDWDFAWKHLRMGLPMAVQFMIISLGLIVIQSVCNTFGPETIAGFISATRLEQLALQPMVSFGIAMAVFTAQNYGAQKYDRIREGVKQCSLVSLFFCGAAAVSMFFFANELISLFTAEYDELLMRQASLYIKMSVPCYFFLGQIFVYRNALQGMGISIVPLVSSLLELVVRGISALVLASMWGYFGICCASPICWITACLFTGGCYFYVRNTMMKRN
ncbi:MATE family efflux transporter [Megasphaera sueciensis]|uniref:MATE family efflux transporter n=1 Tax=Megasphaera sueciensis TaxID=349094 RepID=UPI003D08F2A6